jgi:hypothetical protein
MTLAIAFPNEQPRSDAVTSLKNEILGLVSKHRGVSFVEVASLPGAAGQHDISSERNVIYWSGLSEDACRAVLELRSEGFIYFQPCEILVYLIDGEILQLPEVRSSSAAERGYKKPHWLPVVLNAGPQPNASRLNAGG